MNRDCWRASILVCAAALGAAGCASTGPAPVEDRSINPSSRSHAASAAPKTAAPASGTYRVERGDTLYSIAFRHGIDYRELAEWNGIAPPYTIYPGRELRLSSPRGAARPIAQTSPPPPTAAPPPPVTRTTQPNPPPFEPVVAQPPPSTNAGTPSHVGSPTAPPPIAATPPPPAPSDTAAASGDVAWRWPADGQVVGSYVVGDPMRQGIDIAGKSGAPVRAAADGTVVYSGNGLIGYGELIIVKHNPAFLSAYGHNRKRLVQEGDRVKAGQTIAEMGSSSANRDELHFEIRRNGKPSNPLDYLPHR
ncbi:MAG TPA: peptidoglycan DD-metalloendopeptidase family protein [Rhodanobacteraceae bacterium]|nr:peptidoglycan DD-metalloendopeptidase family protein [Rhodanobacteraceae bacterium]